MIVHFEEFVMIFRQTKVVCADSSTFKLYLIPQYLKVGCTQHAKKVVSDSPGLVDFAIGLVIFVLNLPDGQVLFFGEIQITEGL